MKNSTIWKIRGKSNWDLISKGKTFHTDFIWIKYYRLETDSAEPVRLGFALSKKYGNAVLRNRFKRRVREIVRKQSVEKNLPASLILLVGANSKLKKEVSFIDAENSVSAFISSLK